jgi:hypothetical protein
MINPDPPQIGALPDAPSPPYMINRLGACRTNEVDPDRR